MLAANCGALRFCSKVSRTIEVSVDRHSRRRVAVKGAQRRGTLGWVRVGNCSLPQRGISGAPQGETVCASSPRNVGCWNLFRIVASAVSDGKRPQRPGRCPAPPVASSVPQPSPMGCRRTSSVRRLLIMNLRRGMAAKAGRLRGMAVASPVNLAGMNRKKTPSEERERQQVRCGTRRTQRRRSGAFEPESPAIGKAEVARHLWGWLTDAPRAGTSSLQRPAAAHTCHKLRWLTVRRMRSPRPSRSTCVAQSRQTKQSGSGIAA